MLPCTYQEFVFQEYNSSFDIHVRLLYWPMASHLFSLENKKLEFSMFTVTMAELFGNFVNITLS